MSSVRAPLVLQKQPQDPKKPLEVQEEKEIVVADESTPLMPKAMSNGFSFAKFFSRLQLVKQVKQVPEPFDLFKLQDLIHVLKARRTGISLDEKFKINEALKFVPFANNVVFQNGFHAINATTRYLTKTKNPLHDFLRIDPNDESIGGAFIALNAAQQKILTTLGVLIMDAPTSMASDTIKPH